MPTSVEFWITTCAILVSPLLAVQVGRRLDILREGRARRERIFHALMATRLARTSLEHVRALNEIDLAWWGDGPRWSRARARTRSQVRLAWKEYREHLNTDSKQDGWNHRAEDLFAALLHAMSTSVGFDFDKSDLRSSVYSPVALGEFEFDQLVIRRGLAQWLIGKRAVRVTFAPPGDVAETGEAPARQRPHPIPPPGVEE